LGARCTKCSTASLYAALIPANLTHLFAAKRWGHSTPYRITPYFVECAIVLTTVKDKACGVADGHP